MPISKDLFLAILSLDSYNRGYGAGIGGLAETSGGQIGTATISDNLASLGMLDQAKAAGFYAIAYDTEYGTVISFRGTDFSPDSGMANDIADGWPLGAGNFFVPQALLSVEFLDAVQPGF